MATRVNFQLFYCDVLNIRKGKIPAVACIINWTILKIRKVYFPDPLLSLTTWCCVVVVLCHVIRGKKCVSTFRKDL